MLRDFGRTSVLMLAVAGGCGVERTMRIESDPPGALVYMNHEEVGRTPLQRDFTWYGKYDVVLRKEGFETVQTVTDVKAPWWQWVPFDLVAELIPVRLKDRHELSYGMREASTQPADAREVIENGRELRDELQSGVSTVITKRSTSKAKHATTTTKSTTLGSAE